MSWQKAVDAAWRAYGTRHYRAVLAWQLAGKLLVPALVLVGLAGIVGAAVWLVRHVHAPHISVPGAAGWLLALLATAAVAGAVAAWKWWNPMAVRRWWQKTLAGLAAVGAGLLVWLWKGSS